MKPNYYVNSCMLFVRFPL